MMMREESGSQSEIAGAFYRFQEYAACLWGLLSTIHLVRPPNTQAFINNNKLFRGKIRHITE
jgi:hypothetical protein